MHSSMLAVAPPHLRGKTEEIQGDVFINERLPGTHALCDHSAQIDMSQAEQSQNYNTPNTSSSLTSFSELSFGPPDI